MKYFADAVLYVCVAAVLIFFVKGCSSAFIEDAKTNQIRAQYEHINCSTNKLTK